MKLIQSLPLALVALTQLPLAANALTVAKGDVLLGFRATALPGQGTSYVVDIGSAATFRNATGPITIANLSADLEGKFGSDWQTRTADMFWGVGSCPDKNNDFNGDPASTLYLSQSQTGAGIAGSPLDIPSSAQRGTIGAKLIDALGYGLTGGLANSTATTANPHASLQPDTNLNAWRGYLAPGGTAGKAGSTGTLDFYAGDIEARPDHTLGLFRYTPGNVGVYLGYFKIEGNGDVTYTPAPAAVGYATWADTNAGGQSADLDFNHNGIANGIEFFTGSSTGPTMVSGQITWPRASGRTVNAVYVQTSSNLQSWSTVTANLAGGSGPVSYTLPPNQTKIFARLLVTP